MGAQDKIKSVLDYIQALNRNSPPPPTDMPPMRPQMVSQPQAAPSGRPLLGDGILGMAGDMAHLRQPYMDYATKMQESGQPAMPFDEFVKQTMRPAPQQQMPEPQPTQMQQPAQGNGLLGT